MVAFAVSGGEWAAGAVSPIAWWVAALFACVCVRVCTGVGRDGPCLSLTPFVSFSSLVRCYPWLFCFVVVLVCVCV